MPYPILIMTFHILKEGFNDPGKSTEHMTNLLILLLHYLIKRKIFSIYNFKLNNLFIKDIVYINIFDLNT